MTQGDDGSHERLWNYALVAALAIGCLYLFGWGIGSYSLSDPWEPRYPNTVREMMQRGEWITPYEGGEIRWTKPILIYWAMYVPMLIWGNSEFTARLPSVLAATLGVLAIYFSLSRLRGRRTGLIAACILATIPQYFFMARQATPDMLLTAFLAAAMAFFALGRFGKEHQRRYFVMFYASVGLAFLAKGPVAGAVVVAALLLFWLIDFEPSRLLSVRKAWADFRSMLVTYHVPLGILVFLAVAGPWYAAIWIKHGGEFLDSFVGGENLARFASPVKDLQGSASKYVQTMFHGMFPWIGFLPPAVLFLFYDRPQVDEELRQRWYFLSWFTAIFLLFTFSGTKVDHYILPITASLAVLVALVWERYLDDCPFWIRPAFLLALGFTVLPIRDMLVIGDKYILDVVFTKRRLVNVDAESALKILLVCWAVALLAGVFVRRSRIVAGLVVLIAFGNAIYFNHHVLPEQAEVRSVKQYVEVYQQYRTPESELLFIGNLRRTIIYYSGGEDQFRRFSRSRPQELADYVKGKPSIFIVAERDYLTALGVALRDTTGFTWFRLKSDNPNYDLLTNFQLPDR